MDFLLFKPLEKNEEDFILILSKIFGMNLKLIKEMKNYFKKDFYLIISLFDGLSINFPSIKELNGIKQKMEIYYKIKEKLPVPDFNELIEDISNEYHISSNQAYLSFREIRDWLETNNGY
jgi:hypothetical protein